MSRKLKLAYSLSYPGFDPEADIFDDGVFFRLIENFMVESFIDFELVYLLMKCDHRSTWTNRE